VIKDINHFWGADLAAGNTGDLATVSGITRSQQRILRRLLTNPGDYLFQPDYGAGLPGYVGQSLDVPKLTALIRSQILMEDAVAHDPAPQITVGKVNADLTAISVRIAYTDAPSGAPAVLAFNVSA